MNLYQVKIHIQYEQKWSDGWQHQKEDQLLLVPLENATGVRDVVLNYLKEKYNNDDQTFITFYIKDIKCIEKTDSEEITLIDSMVSFS